MKSDELFLKELRESRVSVNKLANKVRDEGVAAWVFPERTRPTKEERRDYGDSGDMVVQGRVEHKTRKGKPWTNAADYPYRTVFISECYYEDKQPDAPLAYIVENEAGTHAAVIYGWTRDKWEVQEIYDKKSKRKLRVYSIDKRYVRFCDLATDRLF